MKIIKFWMLTISLIVVSGQVFAKGAGNRCLEALGYSRQLPVFEQSTPYTCGPTVILSILSRRGLLAESTTDTQLGKMMGSNSEVGTSPQAMVRILKHFGLGARIFLSNNPTEFLAQLQSNKDHILLVRDGEEAHWVGLSGFSGNRVKLMDPWKNQGSLKYISRTHLIDIWNSVPFDAQTTYNYLSIEVF